MLLGTRKLKKAMEQAESYEEWKEAALALDKSLGLDRWRSRAPSSLYDNNSIRLRLDSLQSQRARHDYRGLLFTLGEGIHGNIGGMGTSLLYEKANFGTKQLVVDYVEEVVGALELLASEEVDEISFEEKLEFFQHVNHCFGRSALMMSGSGMLLYFHFGVVKALWLEGLLPNIMSGSSGGALVGSLICTHTDKELNRMLTPEYLLEEFERIAGPHIAAGGLLPSMLKAEEVEDMISRMIPDMTFKEAFERTGRTLNISIAPAETHQTSRLLNAATSPNVLIQKSCLASAAVPGLFPPVTLEARDKWGERQPYLPSRKWVDGSVSDDLPGKRLARLYGVNHNIVSQANPVVLPFLNGRQKPQGAMAIIRDTIGRNNREWMNASAAILRKPLSRETVFARTANLLLSLVNQEYAGDVNILPRTRLHNPFKIMSHLTPDEIMTLVDSGERSTWRKIEMVRVQTRISSVLGRIMQDYEAKNARMREGPRRKTTRAKKAAQA